MSNPTLETNVTLEGFSRIDFEAKKVRKGMRQIGADVRKHARRLIARRAISAAGEYPGRQSGAMMRSIKAKVSRSGFMVVVRPQKTAEMGEDFYPAFLHYGVRQQRDASVAKRHGKQAEGAYRLAPRRNFMTDALEARRDNARSVLRGVLQDSLIPRK